MTANAQPPSNRKAISAGILASVLLIAGGLVSKWEPARHNPNMGYWDPIGQVATACEGHTGGVIVGHWYSDAECESFKQQDLIAAVFVVDRCIHVPLTAHQAGALVDAVYNLGPAVVCSSTLGREINSGASPWTWCPELKRWNHGGGRVLRGLTNRRFDDLAACMTADTT